MAKPMRDRSSMTPRASKAADLVRARYEERKPQLIALLGDSCVECGTDENLEFDHIDPTTKSFNILESWAKPIEVLLPEIAKCQLLCKNCHRAKTTAERAKPILFRGITFPSRKAAKAHFNVTDHILRKELRVA